MLIYNKQLVTLPCCFHTSPPPSAPFGPFVFALPVLFVTFGNMLYGGHTSVFKSLVASLFLWLLQSNINAQSPSFNFHQLGTANGLANPAVRSIVQDKYGYIWIATLNGLNRFNGYEIKVFQHKRNDSFSLPQSIVPALYTDDTGNLWVAQSTGIYRYDYHTGHFILQPGSNGIATNKMLRAAKNEMYISSNAGLMVFNTLKGSFSFLKNNATGLSRILLGRPVKDYCTDGKGNIYLVTDSGLVLYNRLTGIAQKIVISQLKNETIETIAVDSSNHIWISYGANGSLLLKMDTNLMTATVYAEFFESSSNLRDNRIATIFTDNKGRLWLGTVHSGLCLYNPATNKFIHYEHDPLQPTSISHNLISTIYQDGQGLIWVGTEVDGVNYFDPGQTFFHSIQPSFNQSPTLPDYWGRAAGEDTEGNLWLGTAGGLAKYDPQKNTYRLFQNTNDKNNALHYNSVRSVLCDSGTVWIGTGGGLNKYHIRTGKMDFLGLKDGVPLSFFWSIIKDHQNNTWFASRDGIYKYSRHTQQIKQPDDDGLLAAYVKNNTVALLEDSRQRIWFGFYSEGLLMYDKNNKKIQHWIKNDTDSTTLSNNHITSLAEDKMGNIWIATLDGLNCYNTATNRFTQYLRGNGMVSEKAAALMVDSSNRLWFAGSKGLCMLDASRKFFKYFDVSDGLPTADFNNQSAFKLGNGSFIYPSLKGFVQFNPYQYADKSNTAAVYISSFKVFGNELTTPISFEEKQQVVLQPGENFFSVEITGLSYANPNAIWYAHKLEPFDKEWVYSKERNVSYTNVPGGKYNFYYKASNDINKWNANEKKLEIILGTVFYKTGWFRFTIILLAASVLYLLYRFRLNQQEKVYSLQTKAYSLEKEKAQVMYESLKQQLNPHFLFNSLTSLGGLISSNPAHAKQFLERMSKIYRYILKSRDHETVPLIEELKLAETYIQLQQTRFKNGLQLQRIVAEEFLYRKIAPVTIQNLVENAIKHNILTEEKPLMIMIFIEADFIVVRNNLQRKKFVETSNQQGLASMQALYRYLSGQPVIIEEDEIYFTVKIPLI